MVTRKRRIRAIIHGDRLIDGLFQGGHIKINLKSEIPVQVDGEPWVAAPSEVVVLKSALKVSITVYAHNPLM